MRWLLHTHAGRLTLLAWTLVMVLGVTLGIVLALHRADTASREAKAQCVLDKLAAEAPIIPHGQVGATSELGLKISAGTRQAYYDADCQLGRLAPADPLIFPFLPERLWHR